MAFMDRFLLEASGNSFKEVQILEETHIIKTVASSLSSVVKHTRQKYSLFLQLWTAQLYSFMEDGIKHKCLLPHLPNTDLQEK